MPDFHLSTMIPRVWSPTICVFINLLHRTEGSLDIPARLRSNFAEIHVSSAKTEDTFCCRKIIGKDPRIHSAVGGLSAETDDIFCCGLFGKGRHSELELDPLFSLQQIQ